MYRFLLFVKTCKRLLSLRTKARGFATNARVSGSAEKLPQPC